jgi:hypothetical protein
MNCKQVQNLLNAYVDRELGCEEGYAVRTHLHDCPACNEEFVELVTVKQLIGGMVAEDPSKDFEARLMRAVFQDEPVTQKRGFRLRPIFAFSGVGLASMAATLAVILIARPTEDPGSNVARRFDIEPSIGRPAASNGPDGIQNIAFEIQRDQIYAVGPDAASGVTVVSASHGPRQ